MKNPPQSSEHAWVFYSELSGAVFELCNSRNERFANIEWPKASFGEGSCSVLKSIHEAPWEMLSYLISSTKRGRSRTQHRSRLHRLHLHKKIFKAAELFVYSQGEFPASPAAKPHQHCSYQPQNLEEHKGPCMTSDIPWHTLGLFFVLSKDLTQNSSLFLNTRILLLIHTQRQEGPLWNSVESREIFNAVRVLHLTLTGSIPSISLSHDTYAYGRCFPLLKDQLFKQLN